MNHRMKLFADEWLTGAHTGKQFNGRAAYEYAGYSLPASNPSANASKLLRHPDVQEYIKQRMDEHAMSATEVLLRFTEIARAEIGDVVTVETRPDGKPMLVIDPEKVAENKRFIKQVGFDSNGNPKIEFHDSMAALRDIARVRGMLKDGIELSGPGGSAVPVAMSVQFVDADGGEVAGLEETGDDVKEPEDFSDIEDYPDDDG